ncbi:ComEA family DNA-binding protein [Xanthomonas massiliensis]|uniref:ComEA family DNA-binding protein n=1 Tax=Xanthomonas massiliensis TaxID=1720302 RepID=UPI00164D2D8D|nr:helix-hairpin-helix domain-containing protein [Xanthomonas massiliensis]
MWSGTLARPAGKPADRFPNHKERFMKSFATTLKSLALALLLTGTAHAVDRVDINSASAEELDRVLVNVGPAKAQAIVDYRTEHGPFKSAEELALVKGIGLKTAERNRDLIEVGNGKSRAATPARTAAPKPVERR